MILAACLAALLTAQTADVGTGLRLGAGYREGNPLLPRALTGAAVVKASATTTLVVTGWRIRKAHPRLATSLFLLGAVSGSLGAWHNTRLLRSRHP